MELKATRPAQYSRSPLARSFQTITMAMQRAKPIENQARHVLLMPGQKGDGQQEHQDRADDPVLHQGECQHLDVPEHEPQLFIFHLGQGRIHHQDQANGDRDISGTD